MRHFVLWALLLVCCDLNDLAAQTVLVDTVDLPYRATTLPHGKLITKRTILSADKDEINEMYSLDGALLYRCYMVNGELHGPITMYYRSGGLKFVKQYDQGCAYGKYYMYYENRQLMVTGSFADNAAILKEFRKKVSGKLDTLVYTDQVMQVSDTVLTVPSMSCPSDKDGTWMTYDSTGHLIQKDHYEKGELVKTEYFEPDN